MDPAHCAHPAPQDEFHLANVPFVCLNLPQDRRSQARWPRARSRPLRPLLRRAPLRAPPAACSWRSTADAPSVQHALQSTAARLLDLPTGCARGATRAAHIAPGSCVMYCTQRAHEHRRPLRACSSGWPDPGQDCRRPRAGVRAARRTCASQTPLKFTLRRRTRVHGRSPRPPAGCCCAPTRRHPPSPAAPAAPVAMSDAGYAYDGYASDRVQPYNVVNHSLAPDVEGPLCRRLPEARHAGQADSPRPYVPPRRVRRRCVAATMRGARARRALLRGRRHGVAHAAAHAPRRPAAAGSGGAIASGSPHACWRRGQRSPPRRPPACSRARCAAHLPAARAFPDAACSTPPPKRPTP
jgi:hypothetical protein